MELSLSTLTFVGKNNESGFIGVIDGTPYAVTKWPGGAPVSVGRDWGFPQAADNVDIRTARGQYLAYDSAGKSEMVTLPDKSNLWKKTELDEKPQSTSENLRLQAATGPLANHYLDYADDVVKFGEVVAHRLILSEKPKHISRLTLHETDQ